MDCGTLVQLLQSRDRIRFHSLRVLLLDIVTLLDRNWTISVSLIAREANEVADYLAKLGAATMDNLVILDNPPL